MKALKNDKNKPSFSNLPQLALWEVMRSFQHGEVKYKKFNYSNGMEYTRLIDACLRHCMQALQGIDIDKDSGEDKLYHLANACASLLMCLDAQLTNKIIDNRNKIYLKGEQRKSKNN